MNKTDTIRSLTETMGCEVVTIKSDENKLLDAVIVMTSKPLALQVIDAGGTVFEDFDNLGVRTPRYTPEMLETNSFRQRLLKREEQIKELSPERQKEIEAQGNRRQANQVTGFLSKAKAIELITSDAPYLLIKDCGIGMIGDGKAFFLADDHCWGHGNLPAGWVGMGLRIEHTAEAVEDFLKCYGRDEKHLDSVEALCEYLNANY